MSMSTTPSAPTIASPWLDVARSAFLEDLYRGRSVLCVGVGDGEALGVLVDRGAAHVVAVDGDAQAVERARQRLVARGVTSEVELHVGDIAQLGRERHDVVMVRAGERLPRLGPIKERMTPGGWLVLSATNRDRDGESACYFEITDALGALFPEVTMLGAAPLWGASLAPFGAEEAEPLLDAALAPAQRPSVYVAVAGTRRLPLGYGVVLLPSEAVSVPSPAASAPAPREPARDVERARLEQSLTTAVAEIAELRETVASSESERERVTAEHARTVAELERARAQLHAQAQAQAHAQAQAQAASPTAEARVREAERSRNEAVEAFRARERALEDLRAAALKHAEEMRVLRTGLDERDAYIAELERGGRAIERLQSDLGAASLRAAEAETRERAARRRVAELEGALLRLQHEGPAAATAPAAPPAATVDTSALEAQIAELRAQLEKQKQRADDLQREAWAHLKGRSEAEAAAAEVREDTVRKLKDARKIANLELMRAMEEATKKAVSLKEELTRTERERKELLAQVKQLREADEPIQAELSSLRAEVERLRAAPAPAPATDTTALESQIAELRGVVEARDAELAQLSPWKEEAARARQELAGAQAELASLPSLRAELASLPSLREELGRAREELSSLPSLQDEVSSLRGELDRARAEHPDVDALRAQLANARAELASFAGIQQDLDRARASRDEAEQLRIELAHARHELGAFAAVRQELDHAREEHTRLREALAAAEARPANPAPPVAANPDHDRLRARLADVESALAREAEWLGAVETRLRQAAEALHAPNGEGGAPPTNGEAPGEGGAA